MDILASMLAYLTCVTGIIGALCLATVLYFSTPGQPALTHSAAIAIRTSATKISPVNLNALETPVSSTATPEPLPQANVAATAHAAKAAADARQAQLSAAQLRRLVQEERAKRWAYKDPDFESRFMSYAD
jgi:hypothetical protein